MPKRSLQIIAGPNGSGKSTLATQLLAGREVRFLNADEIARELDPTDQLGGTLAAGRIYFRRLTEALGADTDLAIESTLSGRSLLALLEGKHAKTRDSSVHFLHIAEPTTCILRIQERFRKGGHYVAPEDVERRFHRSHANFWRHYRFAVDRWNIFANDGDRLKEVATGAGELVDVLDPSLFDRFLAIAQGDSQ
jgi:predicted ABC-type ATPase